MDRRRRTHLGLCVMAVVATVAWRNRFAAPAASRPAPTPGLAREPASIGTDPNTVGPTEPAPAAVAVAAAPIGVPDERAMMLARLRETRACFDSQTCDFPRTDPRAYDFAVGRRIALDLAQLHARFGPDAALAREFLAVEDGFVREEALRMIAELPPDDETLAALTEHLGINADPDLAAQTLGVLARYLGGDAEPRVHDLIGRMLTGPHFAAERASRDIATFVNESSYDGYRATVGTLPPGSKVARNVRAALTEFARHRAGG